jgi:hypothetical protein
VPPACQKCPEISPNEQPARNDPRAKIQDHRLGHCQWIFWGFVVLQATSSFYDWITGKPDGRAHEGQRCGPEHHWVYVRDNVTDPYLANTINPASYWRILASMCDGHGDRYTTIIVFLGFSAKFRHSSASYHRVLRQFLVSAAPFF